MDKELKKFINDTKKAFDGVQILLFGSRATGTYASNSDYDLIIISKEFENVPFANRAYNVWIKTSANIAADIICYAPKEVNKLTNQSVILQSAMKNAVKLA